MLTPATREAEEKNCVNLGGGGCSESRSCHCTPACAMRGWRINKTNKQTNKSNFVCYAKDTRNVRWVFVMGKRVFFPKVFVIVVI